MSETRKLSQQETMVRGTAWSTAGNFISRLIGALYIIPWYAWMGKNGAEANALFGMGYEIYAMFLSISTVGIPVAVAKLVSKYNTLGQSETSIYMVKKILHIMALLGAIFAAIMYIGAPFLLRSVTAERIWCECWGVWPWRFWSFHPWVSCGGIFKGIIT